jgi:hypothetical protein
MAPRVCQFPNQSSICELFNQVLSFNFYFASLPKSDVSPKFGRLIQFDPWFWIFMQFDPQLIHKPLISSI